MSHHWFVPGLFCLSGAATLLGGCAGSGASTTSDSGRSELAFTGACFEDCSLDHPIAVGSSEGVAVSGDASAAGLGVQSSDERVARFVIDRHECSCERDDGKPSESYGPLGDDAKCRDGFTLACKNYVNVTARAAGSAKILFVDSSGATVDSASFVVREPAQATFKTRAVGSWVDASAVSGSVGDTAEVAMVLLDSDGDELLSSAGMWWRTDDVRVAGVQHDDSLFQRSRGNFVKLSFVGEGNTRLSVSAGKLQVALPVRVER